MRRNRQRGALLGIVMILLVVVLAASVFAFWGLKSDTGGVANDRLARQLFDCAEQGLALGKQYFSQPSVRGQWGAYFGADSTAICAVFPCPPFALNQTGAVPAGYPGSAPYTNNVTMGVAPAPTITLTYQVGIYNNPGDPGGVAVDGDNRVVVYSRCTDPLSRQFRVVQALINVPKQQTGDYFGQAGNGFHGQGNTNNGF